MSLELASTSTSTEKTEISLFKLFCKHQPPSWDGSLYHVDLDIGRDLSCDIRIQYDGDGSKLFMLISKKHTTIRLSYKGVFVKDSNSKNGTFVGNTMVDAESWHELQERDHISLGCPFPLRLGNGFYNNPYALQIHDLTRFRMLVHERIWEKRKKNEPCNGPRSWDDIKRGFDTICHNHNGKSVSEGSPVRKRCKDTVIDLTGDTVTHVSTRERSYFEADGANLPGKLTQATVSDPTYSFRLVKPHVMQIPNGPKRIIQRMGIFNVPREFFLDHQHGLRRLNMVRIKNVRKVMLIMPHSDIGLASMFNDFLKEFSEYMASEYIPKAFKNIDNLIKTIPENILCYCGLSDGSHKHLALPAYRLECNHLVCGACLREAVRQGKHITDVYAPCCNMKMRAMPYRISSLDDYMNMQLEAQNLKKEYDAAYRIPSHIASKLEKELHNVSQQKQGDVSYREMASHGNISDLTEGKTCNLLPKPTFIVCKTAMTSSCEACNKTLSDEENNLVFGIQQDRASHWYHIKCVDPGIRFRALTEGIHGFGTMDSITKKQVIQCIMNNDIKT